MSTAPYVLGGIAALALVKTFFRPHRAVVREGTLAACPGQNRYQVCDPSIVLSTPADSPVYATAGGRVVAVGADFLHVASLHEPVVLMYDGIAPSVVEGQYVGRGAQIGTSSGQVAFSVTEFLPGGGAARIDPSSWLASRGQKLAAKYTGPGTSWCEQGRNIEVPASAGRICGFQEPERGGFALLPISVSVER